MFQVFKDESSRFKDKARKDSFLKLHILLYTKNEMTYFVFNLYRLLNLDLVFLNICILSLLKLHVLSLICLVSRQVTPSERPNWIRGELHPIEIAWGWHAHHWSGEAVGEVDRRLLCVVDVGHRCAGTSQDLFAFVFKEGGLDA